MRKYFLTSFLLILTTFLYGQEYTISVAPTINNALYYHFVAGGAGRDFKTGFAASIDYSFHSDKRINSGFGICYQFARVKYTPNMNTPDFFGKTDKVSLISLNFALFYHLKNNFYLNLNPLMDFQLNYSSNYLTDKQTGLGIAFSFGKHLKLNDNALLNIQPIIWIHNIVPFASENMPQRLTSLGMNVGLVFGKSKSKSKLPD